MLFENLIPEIINSYDPQTAYWPSSPSGGWGHDESYLSGDVHYWGVWWGEEPFELYQQKIGRFNSEFGFQAMPAIATLNSMVKKDLQWPGSPEIENFQKHPRGTQLIDTYMQRDFPVPNATDEYVYVSQLVQLYGLEMAIEGQRLSRPHSMGTLFWQFNDAWPAISWSVIDYYGRPKATYYHLQRLYNQYLIGVEVVQNKIIGIFLNESQSRLNVRANFDLLDYKGNLLHSSSLPMELEPNEVNRLDAGFAAEVLKNVDQRKVWLRVRSVANDEILAEKYHFFAKPKNLLLPQHEISLYLMPDTDKIEIVLSSTVFLKNLQLTSNDDLGRWETNFFDLPPGKPRRINFYPSGNIEIGKLRFMTNSLNDLIN
jgi:beta-mannosidase